MEADAAETYPDSVIDPSYVLRCLITLVEKEDKLRLVREGEVVQEEDETEEIELGCFLWDIATSAEFVDFMLKHELLSILLRILANPTHSHRFREVIVGVLGNVGSVRSSALNRQDLQEMLVGMWVTNDDPPTLAELARCFTACVCTAEGQQSWAPSLLDDDFIAKLAWILRSSMSELLLQRCAELLYALAYMGGQLATKLVWDHDMLGVLGAQLGQPEDRITEKIAHLMWEVVELLLSRPGLAVHPENQLGQTSDVAEERVMRKMADAFVPVAVQWLRTEVDEDDVHKICTLLLANTLAYLNEEQMAALIDARLVVSLVRLLSQSQDSGDEPIHLAVWVVLAAIVSHGATAGPVGQATEAVISALAERVDSLLPQVVRFAPLPAYQPALADVRRTLEVVASHVEGRASPLREEDLRVINLIRGFLSSSSSSAPSS